MRRGRGPGVGLTLCRPKTAQPRTLTLKTRSRSYSSTELGYLSTCEGYQRVHDVVGVGAVEEAPGVSQLVLHQPL